MSIYSALAQHQVTEAWFGRDLIETLQTWAERFSVQFKLDIPKLVLCVEPLPVSRLGHFRRGHNGFGLEGEIAINARYVNAMPPWEILGTLLHEMLHAWQAAHGAPSGGNHHNAEFREKAAALGLVVGRRGIMGYTAESPFKGFLRKHGVEVPAEEFAPRERRVKGRSKQKKWSCGCTNVRCAKAEFYAQCLKCAQVFRCVEAEEAKE